MLILDLCICAALVLFATVVGVGRGRHKISVLFVIALIAVGSSAAAVLLGRALAAPAFVLGSCYLLGAAAANYQFKKDKKHPLLATLLLVPVIAAILPLIVFAPTVEFPRPEGCFPVGVRSAELHDASRGNAWNAQDQPPRRILLRVWYPAEANTHRAGRDRNTQAEQRSAASFGESGLDPFTLIGQSLLRAETHSVWRRPAAAGSFPLLIFSHGYAGDVTSNAVLMEQLASRGYVVASISHPGESARVIYPDGDQEPQAEEILVMLDAIASSGIWEVFGADTATRMQWIIDTIEKTPLYRERLPIWSDDFQATLDAFEQGTIRSDLDDVMAAIDFDAIGFLGMSAGAAAAPAACHRDSRCSATASLDVLAGLPELRNRPLRIPGLIIESGHPHRMGGQDLYYEPHASFDSRSDIYRIVFPENGHFDFTDSALALTPIGKRLLPHVLPVFGPVDGWATLLTQSRLVGQFFDVHLRGETPDGFPDTLLENSPIARRVDGDELRAWNRRIVKNPPAAPATGS